MARIKRRPIQWQRNLQKWAIQQRDPRVLQRAQIILLACNGFSSTEISSTLLCSYSHVERTKKRFEDGHREGLLDRRKLRSKLTENAELLMFVRALLEKSPQDFQFQRTVWSQESLVMVVKKTLTINVSTRSMSRVLKEIRARRGRPKPAVRCPWSRRRKNKCLKELKALEQSANENIVVVYQDEVEVCLYPNIGWEWMNYGHQRKVYSPLKNAKKFISGALNPCTQKLSWVEGPRKNSDIFIANLRKLETDYPLAQELHVIADNFRIHKSKKTRAELAKMPRITLHFLPPYCPDHNRIERLWRDFHTHVTRNHRQPNLEELMCDARYFLDSVQRWKTGQYVLERRPY